MIRVVWRAGEDVYASTYLSGGNSWSINVLEDLTEEQATEFIADLPAFFYAVGAESIWFNMWSPAIEQAVLEICKLGFILTVDQATELRVLSREIDLEAK